MYWLTALGRGTGGHDGVPEPGQNGGADGGAAEGAGSTYAEDTVGGAGERGGGPVRPGAVLTACS